MGLLWPEAERGGGEGGGRDKGRPRTLPSELVLSPGSPSSMQESRSGHRAACPRSKDQAPTTGRGCRAMQNALLGGSPQMRK